MSPFAETTPPGKVGKQAQVAVRKRLVLLAVIASQHGPERRVEEYRAVDMRRRHRVAGHHVVLEQPAHPRELRLAVAAMHITRSGHGACRGQLAAWLRKRDLGGEADKQQQHSPAYTAATLAAAAIWQRGRWAEVVGSSYNVLTPPVRLAVPITEEA